jgi:hypothetical protein
MNVVIKNVYAKLIGFGKKQKFNHEKIKKILI